MLTVSHARGTLPTCCFAVRSVALARRKKTPCESARRIQHDRLRPDVVKRHLILEDLLDVASRKSLNRIPMSLDCHRVRQHAIRVGCWHRPIDDRLGEGDLEAYRTWQIHHVRSYVNSSMVWHLSTLISQTSSELFLQCNLTINSQGRVRVAARSSPRQHDGLLCTEGAVRLRCRQRGPGNKCKNWSQISTYRLRPHRFRFRSILSASVSSPCRGGNGSCISSHVKPSPAQARKKWPEVSKDAPPKGFFVHSAVHACFAQPRRVISTVPLRHEDRGIEHDFPFWHHHVICAMAVQKLQVWQTN